eukprot:Rhum_TRINITY_DN17192_c0_g1::Rhum_TRINITY_DN17192_c0_g1_i1::g.165254::m.165254/K01262/pepP; Xaa-Pro aminopeptidase
MKRVLLRRCVARRWCTAAAAADADIDVVCVTERIGQPTSHTHPHLVLPHEVTTGISRAEYRARRKGLFDALPANSVVVVPAYSKKIMTNDIPWRFRQRSGFLYLTGCHEPGAVAVFHKTADGEGRWQLFLQEKDAQKELWDGVQTGTANGLAYFGPDECLPVSVEQLRESLMKIIASTRRPLEHFALVTGGNTVIDDAVKALETELAGGFKVTTNLRVFPQVMSLKRPEQVQMHKRSAEITRKAFEAAMVLSTPGKSEADVENTMEYVVRSNGADWLAYPPVIAGGDRGLSLHYISNQQVMKDGELLLVDAGAEFHQTPTDVTRTWPVNGRFTAPQRAVYDAVLRIQQQLLKALVVGTKTLELQMLSAELTAEEMLKLGVFSKEDGTAQEIARGPKVRTVFPHAFGHFCGMDIHEPTPPKFDQTGFLPGMMHTVEPGVYIPYDESIPPEYRGICVRIEDNVLLREPSEGNLILTEGTLKDPDAIEAFIAEHRAKPGAGIDLLHL